MDKRPTNRRNVRPDFESLGDGIRELSHSWLNRPLLAKGGVTLTALAAIWCFGKFGLHCLDHPTIGETAKVLGALLFGGLILATVAVTARFVWHERTYAQDQASRKCSPKPRGQSRSP